MAKDNQQRPWSYEERQALAVMYDTYHQPIYRYIYRRIGDIESARELAADVFQSLIQTTQRTSLPANPRAWLFRTAHNVVIDEYRRRKHRQHLDVADLHLHADDDPAEEAHLRLNADRARRALLSLTEEQQQVLVLKYLEGFSNHEVAEILEKSVGAVKALQHRGLRALQQRMEQSTGSFSDNTHSGAKAIQEISR